MTGAVLRAGAWPAVAGVSGVAVVVGGCGAAFPAAATVLLPICFALLAAAAAFTLDEPASLVVDVTPTGPVRRTGIRAVALLAPLAAGALVMLAAAMRGLALPWACGRSCAGRQRAVRIRRGVRGPDADRGTGRGGRHRRRAGADGAQPRAAGRALGPHVPGARCRRPSSDHVWWIVLAVCVVAIAISNGGRSIPSTDSRRLGMWLARDKAGSAGAPCGRRRRDPEHVGIFLQAPADVAAAGHRPAADPGARASPGAGRRAP